MAERVAVIGAGQMGNGIAHVFAQAGFDVTMIDVSADALERGRSTIAGNLDRQIKKGTLQATDKDAILGRVSTAQSIGAVKDAALVVEAATENRDLKFKIFGELDASANPAAILATNTSSISITEIAARTKRPEQVIGMHFMNPVPVMQLVEVIRGLATSDATTTRVLELSKAVGKTPVEVQDYPGFVANRDSHADDQRGGLLPHGGRRNGRVDRHGHEARDEPSDGPTRARGPHRSRHLPRDSRGAPRRTRRSEVPCVPAAAKVRRRRLAWPKDQARFLRLLAKSRCPSVVSPLPRFPLPASR